MVVADTPQQRTPTEGCPPPGSQDSCPRSGAAAGWNGGPGQGGNPYGAQGYSGVDPVNNYMGMFDHASAQEDSG